MLLDFNFFLCNIVRMSFFSEHLIFSHIFGSVRNLFSVEISYSPHLRDIRPGDRSMKKGGGFHSLVKGDHIPLKGEKKISSNSNC